MRFLVLSSFALTVALVPVAAYAQTPPTQTPPTQTPPPQTPPPQTPAQPAAPGAPKLPFTTPAGLLLVQVKPDQTAAFEEMFAKIKAGLAKATDPELSGQAHSWKIYKTAEGMQGNALYVILIDPAKPGTEYSFLEVLHKTLTPEEQRDPATQEMYKKYAAAVAGLNKLNITPVGGGH
jgi:hypothetical protein